MSASVEEQRERFGVERIRRTVGVTASAYDQRRTGERSVRAVEDERLLGRIVALHAANYFAYGYRRMWNALRRAGEHLPRCRVQRLMAAHGIQGAKRRGKPERTTRSDPAALRRPGQAGLHCHTAERPVGLRFHVPALLGGVAYFRGRLHADARRPCGARIDRDRRRRAGERHSGIVRGLVQDRADRRPRLAVPPPIRRRALRVHTSDSFPADAGLRLLPTGSALPFPQLALSTPSGSSWWTP